jgi:hypothetical protein
MRNKTDFFCCFSINQNFVLPDEIKSERKIAPKRNAGNRKEI